MVTMAHLMMASMMSFESYVFYIPMVFDALALEGTAPQ